MTEELRELVSSGRIPESVETKTAQLRALQNIQPLAVFRPDYTRRVTVGARFTPSSMTNPTKLMTAKAASALKYKAVMSLFNEWSLATAQPCPGQYMPAMMRSLAACSGIPSPTSAVRRASASVTIAHLASRSLMVPMSSLMASNLVVTSPIVVTPFRISFVPGR
jgi:hypothetical protein